VEETEDDPATQLIQWWEDVTIHGIGSRVVLVPAPSGWGRTTLLDGFTAAVLNAVPFSVVLRMDGRTAPAGPGQGESGILADRLATSSTVTIPVQEIQAVLTA